MIFRGEVIEPTPLPAGAIARLRELEDARPQLWWPIAVIGGGVTTAFGSIPMWEEIRTSFDPGSKRNIAIALSCIGLVVAGLGTYLTVTKARERAELDERIDEMKAFTPPSTEPIDGYWHY